MTYKKLGLSLCPHCYCMTWTLEKIKGYQLICGKCRKEK